MSNLARYTSCPNKNHWDALDRVLRDLRGNIYLVLHYKRFSVVFEGYSDASWIAKKSGSDGVTGCLFILTSGAVSWNSTRRTIITGSTFEAELCALYATGRRLNGYMDL